MAGLDPAIHDFLCCQDVDARDKPGHDEEKKQRPGAIPAFLFVIASEAKQSSATRKNWIASSQVLLAMTNYCAACNESPSTG
jgi:hypothetical protein